MALQYGKLKEANWGYSKVIAGTITNEFTDFYYHFRNLLMQELKNIDDTNEELAERYIWFGTPVMFADCEQKYYNLKREISTQFSQIRRLYCFNA